MQLYRVINGLSHAERCISSIQTESEVMSMATLPYSDRSILNGRHLKIGSNFPIDCVSFSTNVEKPTFNQLNSGFDYYLIQYLAYHFNYTFDIIHGQFKFGTVVNGTIDGICGMVNRSVSETNSEWSFLLNFQGSGHGYRIFGHH